MLHNHMARLAKADEVGKPVCLTGASKEPEWLDVVNGNGRADYQAAPLASAFIPLYGCTSRLNPTFAAIGGNPADIIGGVYPRLMLGLKGTMTGLAAEAHSALGRVLSRKPRLKLELLTALCAIVHFAAHHIQRPRLFRREGVGGTKPFAPLIAEFVIVGHLPDTHVPGPTAPLAAKPSSCGAIGFHIKRLTANFAIKCNWHLGTIGERSAPVNGCCACKRIEQAQRQGDFFVEPAA